MLPFGAGIWGVSPELSAASVVIDRPGPVLLDPGRDYWVTNASAQLVLPDWADRLITIRNKTGGNLDVTSRSRPLDIGGMTGRIANNATGQAIATTTRWLTTGLTFPAVSQAFAYTGSNQSYVVPNAIGAVLRLSAVGAGGGGSNQSVGGGGGSVLALFDIAAATNLAAGQIAVGTTIAIVVGQQGGYGALTARFGGGGRAGSSVDGSGAGYSGLFLESVSLANAIAIGGGGGGGATGSSSYFGGQGGGTTGGGTAFPGGGGTQSAGGVGYASANSGSALTGGNGLSSAYAGGGGGYYGGGTGSGGGGGSGFLRAGAKAGSTLTAGSGQTAATVAGITGAGQGGALSGNGQHGAVLVEVVAA